ncbi:MAG: L,D-transpeptidase family protein [Bacteroidales bacterium]|nr:L,D-transpeptidase family protein [Bacteroidales bacterium]
MKKRLLYILIIIPIVLFAVTLIKVFVKEPPLSEIDQARRQITEAMKINANLHAQNLFQNAVDYYDSAMAAWQKENEKLIIFRNYDQAREFSELSLKLANRAIVTTNNRILGIEEMLRTWIPVLEKKVQNFDKRFGNLPLSSEDREELAKSKLLLNEGILAYSQANYYLCKSKLESLETLITVLSKKYENKLVKYFEQYELWQSWIDQTISSSKKHKTFCIIVDKYNRKCILYKNGRRIHDFKIELGVNWIGDKNQQGDKSTPEGLYKIVSKKTNGATRYYKAFLIDYPNEEDKKRFLLNKKNGVIKQDAEIGNLIEIHGNGGKGIDWTDGCIALTNFDMDILYSVCTEGTKVTIVGSVKPLHELFSYKQ